MHERPQVLLPGTYAFMGVRGWGRGRRRGGRLGGWVGRVGGRHERGREEREERRVGGEETVGCVVMPFVWTARVMAGEYSAKVVA